MGLTPEYLQEIREKDWRTNSIHVEELLNEIDNLRDRLSCPQEYWECAKEIRTLTKERDDLQNKNRSLSFEIAELIPHPDSIIGSLQKQRDELEEEKSGLYADLIGQEHRLGSRIEILEKENEELIEHRNVYNQNRKDLLRTNEQLYTALQLAQSDLSVKHKYKADVLERSVEKLLKENAALKEALEKIADPRKRDHKEPDEYTQIGCLMHIANEAVINSNGENHE